MRNLLILATLVFCAMTNVQAQEETNLKATTSNEANVVHMPSKWHKMKDERRLDFLFGAVERGDVELAKTMLPDVRQPYYRYNFQGENLLTAAVKAGHYEMVEWLCEDAVINLKNEDGETGLTLALKSKQMGIIDLLLVRAKADLPNDADETPLMLAVNYGYEPALLQKLTDRGANPNRLSNGVTPVFRAAERENIPAVAMLIRNGANPSLANENGEIALFQAVQDNNAVLAGVLLHRATSPADDANWRTPVGETLTNMAVAQHNADLLRVLLEKGADANQVDYLENTPLHLAAERGMEEAVDLLMAHGAYVDAMNIMGATPIMAAAQRGHTTIAEQLAQAGANPNQRDYAGIAANDYGTYTDPLLMQEVDTYLPEETNR